jgi:hypothetical protein
MNKKDSTTVSCLKVSLKGIRKNEERIEELRRD